MPEQVTVSPAVVQAEGTAPLGAAPPAPTEQQIEIVPPATQREQVQAAAGKVTSLSHSAFSRIKDEERAKGREEAQAALAKAAGFETTQDFVQALAGLKNRPPPQQEAPQPPPARTQPAPVQANGTAQDEALAQKNAQREAARAQRQQETTLRELQTATQRASEAERRAKSLQEALDSKEAEMALREEAVATGVKDVDYTLRLLTRELEGKTDQEMAQFDQRAFFEGLRKTKPYLFGESVHPATTGTGTSTTPGAPRPAAVQAQAAANGRIDATKMSPADYIELLRKRGLNPNH